VQKPFNKTKPLAIIFGLYFLFQVGSASAQDGLSDSQIEARVQYIQQALQHGKPAANRWWYGWLIGYSSATFAQGAIGLASKDHETRQDMSLGAATTFLGAMGQIIAPMVPGSAAARLASLPENTPEERKEKLRKAEKLLKACALREKSGRSWQAHAITGGANLCSGLIVWLGFKRSPWEGFGNFALNTAVTELQIWTQPTSAIKDYDTYCSRGKSGQEMGYVRSELNWFVAIYPGRLAISVVF
jgi:hypothetical protein